MKIQVVLCAFATVSIPCACTHDPSPGESPGEGKTTETTDAAHSGGNAAGGSVAAGSDADGRGGASGLGGTAPAAGAGGHGHGSGPDGAVASADESGDRGGASGSGGATVDGGSGPACGPAPARYTLLTGVEAGLVRDNTTGLVWMREPYSAPNNPEPPRGEEARSYCGGRGMRLPTKEEALAIAGANHAFCAFAAWGTWTSTVGTQGSRYWYTVDYLGGAYEQLSDNYPNSVLCVR